MIIGYSIIMAILLFNIAMIAVALLRKKTNYMAKFSTSALILFAFLGVLRIILPLSFPFTHVVSSYDMIPWLGSVLQTDLWPWAGTFNIAMAIIFIWIVGSAVFLFRAVLRLYKHHKQTKTYKHADNTIVHKLAQELGFKRTEIIVSPNVKVPYVTGLIKARIYLPEIELSDDMLAMIGVLYTVAIAADVYEISDESYLGYAVETQEQIMPRVPGGIQVHSSRGNAVGWWTSGTGPAGELFSNLRSNRIDNPNVSQIRTSVRNNAGAEDCSGWIFLANTGHTNARSSVARTLTGNQTWWDYRQAG
ncbi:MAG: M56 family metallopeptidase [Oscillospiraceae bacterium]|nr:M56 family metallopeptidase [Oscillospiraceae bacterium]